MGQQQIAGSFRSVPDNGVAENMEDSPGASTIFWSPGATIIESVQIQPPLGERWSLVSATFTWSGVIKWAAGAGQPYGRLGKLIGALMAQGARTLSTTGQPWVSPALPLPNQALVIDTLWDGSADPSFPIWNPLAAAAPLVPQSDTLSLPVPLELQAGDQLYIGMWLGPMLIKAVSVEICNASWVITYDDNHPPRQGWGGS